jgi:hypothetical protein
MGKSMRGMVYIPRADRSATRQAAKGDSVRMK